jgi:GxxExxY protein
MTENEISAIVLDASIAVHRALGPGLLESAYEECLHYELKQRGMKVQRQFTIPLVYREVHLDFAYRCDLLVDDKVIIEIKAVEQLDNIHMAQLLTYLKMTDLKLGLLINFNVELLKNGYKRVVRNL